MIGFYLLLGAGLSIASFVLYDELLKYQYTKYKDEWIKDGKPRGFFFCPPNSSYWAMTKISFRNLNQHSRWIGNDLEGQQKHARLVFLFKLYLIYIALFFPVVIFASNI